MYGEDARHPHRILLSLRWLFLFSPRNGAFLTDWPDSLLLCGQSGVLRDSFHFSNFFAVFCRRSAIMSPITGVECRHGENAIRNAAISLPASAAVCAEEPCISAAGCRGNQVFQPEDTLFLAGSRNGLFKINQRAARHWSTGIGRNRMRMRLAAAADSFVSLRGILNEVRQSVPKSSGRVMLWRKRYVDEGLLQTVR